MNASGSRRFGISVATLAVVSGLAGAPCVALASPSNSDVTVSSADSALNVQDASSDTGATDSPEEDPVNVAYANLSEGEVNSVTMTGSLQYANMSFSVDRQCMVYIYASAYSLDSGGRRVVLRLKNANDEGVILGSVDSDARHIGPICLPAGSYTLEAVGSSDTGGGTILFAEYDIVGSNSPIPDDCTVEYEPNDNISEATALKNNGFVGVHYNALNGDTTDANKDIDYYSFTLDKAQPTTVHMIGVAGTLFALEDANGNVLHKSLNGDGKNLVAQVDQASSSVKTDTSYSCTLDCGILPAGTYYLFVTNEHPNAAAQPYMGYVLPTQLFTDVSTSDWFYQDVYSAYDRGYMTGYEGTSQFGPTDPLTRAQVTQILFNMEGVNNPKDQTFVRDSSRSYETDFTDVDPNAWYAQAVAWASSAGIVHGDTGSTTFRPNDNVSREELAIMLSRYATLKGIGQARTADLSTYEDASNVDDWARNEVEWAVSNKLMGVNTTSIAPKEATQRAQAAAMFVRLGNL